MRESTSLSARTVRDPRVDNRMVSFVMKIILLRYLPPTAPPPPSLRDTYRSVSLGYTDAVPQIRQERFGMHIQTLDCRI